MITLLIGHRGTGKTSFLKSLKTYAAKNEIRGTFIDLDAEIEIQSRKSISDLFAAGEPAFRALEKKILLELCAEAGPATYIALGAGFEGPLPREAHVLWLRRETDGGGRAFLGRPRLNDDLTPHAEYMHRFRIREHRFKAWAHEQLILPEGYETGLEDFVLKPHAVTVTGDFTLLPEHFREGDSYLEKRATWGIRLFELRDDLLSDAHIARAVAALPAEKILFSKRTDRKLSALENAIAKTDWPLELGPAPAGTYIVSKHERDASLQTMLKNAASSGGAIYKLAIEIENFTELEMGHEWWLKDPAKRAFLPRSKDGRWRWYRSLFGPRMPVHYYREDEGSAADQPLFWQTQLQPAFQDNFAAVLGWPVGHSRSPVEHLEFFKEKKMPFVSIPVMEAEFSFALEFLVKLGLTHAAITSPLKKAAFAACNSLSAEAEELRSVNTLKVVDKKISGHNTDVLALIEIAKDLAPVKEAWLWGGGGVRSSVRKAFPQVKEFSARTGLPHPGTKEFNSPSVLIWASGRNHEFILPPESVKIGRILDLNYGDNSPGLEWAVRTNLPYQSGLKMFKLQAEFQRVFWQGK